MHSLIIGFNQILSPLYIVLHFYHPGVVEARIRNAPCPFLAQMIVKFLPRQRPGAEAGPHLQIDHGLNTPGSQARSSKQSTQPNGGKFEARAPMPGEVRSVYSWTRVIKIFSFCPDLSRKRPKNTDSTMLNFNPSIYLPCFSDSPTQTTSRGNYVKTAVKC